MGPDSGSTNTPMPAPLQVKSNRGDNCKLSKNSRKKDEGDLQVIMKNKWTSRLFACVMAAAMLVGTAPAMTYAEENWGGYEASYLEEDSTVENTDANQDPSGEIVTDAVSDQETGQEINQETGKDQDSQDIQSQDTSDPAKAESEEDLAKASETSWKDKLREGTYLDYLGHVQTYGDLTAVSDGASFGTTGEGKRLEAFSVWKGNAIQDFTGEIVYRAHVQTYGTQDWKSYGEQMGTTGQGKRIEAVQMYLTEELAQYFDIYYCLHVQTFGWTKWVKGSEEDSSWCGTSGLAKRVEAVKVCLVAKDGGSVPEDLHGAIMDYSYLTADSLGSIHYSGHQQTYGDIGPAYAGDYLGIIGESKRLEALSLSLDQGAFGGSVKYRAHVQTYGWQDWVSDGALAGTTGQAKRLEAIQIELEGEISKVYDIYYRVHVQTYGWLDWAKNGEIAGSEGLGKRLESLQIVLVLKGGSAPGATLFPYVNNPLLGQAIAWRGYNEADGSHRAIIDVYNGHYPIARNYAVQYQDAWCATFVSACAIRAGLTDIIPTESGCGQMVELFKSLGEWDENDARVPNVGDVIFYDWDDSGIGDNTGWPDHVGIVAKVSGTTILVIEGNRYDAVETRIIQVDNRYIRGYGVPNYR